jgi:hypothetical protein
VKTELTKLISNLIRTFSNIIFDKSERDRLEKDKYMCTNKDAFFFDGCDFLKHLGLTNFTASQLTGFL